MDEGRPSTAAAPAGCSVPEPQTDGDASLDAALRAALTVPDASAACQVESTLEQLKAAAQAAAPLAVPGPKLRAQLQAALESDQAWQRARAVDVLLCLQRTIAQVSPFERVRLLQQLGAAGFCLPVLFADPRMSCLCAEPSCRPGE